jgi:hypothetical protein
MLLVMERKWGWGFEVEGVRAEGTTRQLDRYWERNLTGGSVV